MAMEAVVNIDWIEGKGTKRHMLYKSVVLKRTDQWRNKNGDFWVEKEEAICQK